MTVKELLRGLVCCAARAVRSRSKTSDVRCVAHEIHLVVVASWHGVWAGAAGGPCLYRCVYRVAGQGAGGIILLDAATTTFPYPLTIQNVMHLFFFVSLGEFFVR